MAWMARVALLVVAIGVLVAMQAPNVLDGLNSNHCYGKTELQLIISAFCVSPVVGMLLNGELLEKKTVGSVGDGEAKDGQFDFAGDGDVGNDDYAQSSIYAVLYAMYKNAGDLTSEHGVKYQFTFNTWGFNVGHDVDSTYPYTNEKDSTGRHPYPKEDPERFGKAAYHWLVTQDAAKAYAKEVADKGENLEIVEIGCGTAAGANLITREVYPTANYLALDMQQAAVDTCNERHATADNKELTCQIVPNGVGRGNPIPRADSSMDFAVISETHIADIRIGDIEKDIFNEIKRVLKPGGLFVWGNAIPTRVWIEADKYLPTVGFEKVSETNHTHGAIIARDLDKERVDLAIYELTHGQYPVMKLPYFGDRCFMVAERLIANFYRHPGTALYKKMVSGYDSYMHQAWRLKE